LFCLTLEPSGVKLQSVQGHTGLTHIFNFLWHSGTPVLRTEWSAQMSKN